METILITCVIAGFGYGLGHYLCRVGHYYARLLTPDDPPDSAMLQAALLGALRARHGWPRHGSRGGGSRRLPGIVAALLAAAYVGLYAGLGLDLLTLALGWALATLVLLALIDARAGLLPDALTQPLLWAGLALAWSDQGLVRLDAALLGAMAIYLALWLFSRCYRLLRRREGLGGGDIKLLSAVGAWLGWPDTLWVLILGSLFGLLHALSRRQRLRMSAALPFGPALILATLTILALRVAERAGGVAILP